MTKSKGTIRPLIGEWPEHPTWDGQRSRVYPTTSEYAEITENWLVGKAEGAENFALRYYRVGTQGFTRKENHPYDHGIVILHGEGKVQIGKMIKPFKQGDVIYIPPDIEHQLINTGPKEMGFLCIIPAKREKKGEVVWSDEKIKFS